MLPYISKYAYQVARTNSVNGDPSYSQLAIQRANPHVTTRNCQYCSLYAKFRVLSHSCEVSNKYGVTALVMLFNKANVKWRNGSCTDSLSFTMITILKPARLSIIIVAPGKQA